MSTPNLPTDPKARKEMPMFRGLLKYFPDACAAVANVSFVGNEQHNPGEEMHWAREKSKDHEDCIVRHLVERGTVDTDGLRHSAKLAWRALALLQLEVEEQQGLPQDPVDEFPNPMTDGPEDSGCDHGPALDPSCGFCRAKLGVTQTVVQRKPRCYIAGPMRGYPAFNFPAFDAARDLAIEKGWDPISPADLDRDNDVHEDSEISDGPEQNRIFAQRDTAAILSLRAEAGDALVLLPGWTASTGARSEFFLAAWVGLTVLDGRTMEPFTTASLKDLWDNLGGSGLGELKLAALRTLFGGQH